MGNRAPRGSGIIAALAAGALGLAACHRDAQPPIAPYTAAAFRAAFDASPGVTRILALLSPT